MLIIRPATLADASAIASVKRRAAIRAYSAFTTEAQLQAWLAKRADEDFIRSRMGGDATFLVAERDGVVVGAGLVKPETLPGAIEPTGYLADVYVAMDGEGVGSKLVDVLLQTARTRYAATRCFVLAGNDNAVQFFAHQGFVETARQANQELPGMLVEMKLDS